MKILKVVDTAVFHKSLVEKALQRQKEAQQPGHVALHHIHSAILQPEPASLP